MDELDSLKIGDKIFWESRYDFGSSYVTRVTKTQITTNKNNGCKYSRKTRQLIGASSWSTEHIFELTKKRIAEINLRNLQNLAQKLLDSIIVPSNKKNLEQFIKALQPYSKVLEWRKNGLL